MKLEAQVVSLDLAKKLKALNVKQESTFYWVLDFVIQNWAGKSDFTGKMEDRPAKKRWTLAMAKGEHEEIYSAFTVAELGEMLPWGTKFEKYRSNGSIRYSVIEVESIKNMAVHDDTEADARAQMLIYLLENKLIPVNGTDGVGRKS